MQASIDVHRAFDQCSVLVDVAVANDLIGRLRASAAACDLQTALELGGIFKLNNSNSFALVRS